MTNKKDKVNQLHNKLDNLLKKQEDFSKEIDNLKGEILKLKATEPEQVIQNKNTKSVTFTENTKSDNKIENAPEYLEQVNEQQNNKTPIKPIEPEENKQKIKSNIEKFIGENLINKIGIVITIIGVAIGSKYAIEHQLVSPATRIILGYLAGAILLGFALKLKKNYESYSAVLLSGSTAIMYFITYLAYSMYSLYPKIAAFALMLVFTALTIFAAIKYNRQVISVIGLVGAYAVPFLLSDGTGKVSELFTYIAIINIGILIIAVKKYWKPLYYSSFGITWLIYLSWYFAKYETNEHFKLAFTFLSVFFGIFYIIFLAYKLIQKEDFKVNDIVTLLANSFIIYGLGYALLNNHETGEQLLGLFTLGNAIIHLIISAVIYSQKLADRNLFYLVFGLVLVFITIAIPVELNGSWVTLLWVGEAALLFWIGRTKNISTYEILSYPLMMLAFLSITHDWATADSYVSINPESRITPLLNISFLTSMLFIAAFGFINFLKAKKYYSPALPLKNSLSELVNFCIPAILLFTIYNTFRIEIATYWDQLYTDSELVISEMGVNYPSHFWNHNFIKYKEIWTVNYSLLFVSLLAFVNFKKLKNSQIGLINLVLIFSTIAAFLTLSLYNFSELRESYLNPALNQHYQSGIYNIVIRYISYIFIALVLFTCYKYTRQNYIKNYLKKGVELLIHASIVWIASSELIHWLNITGSTQSYKLGLSILWGVYSLFLIALGIGKNKKHLRIGAISLFGATLAKLFFYDISHLNTISKTIVLVSLGVLLLIISFLYNKYKHIISDEINEEK